MNLDIIMFFEKMPAALPLYEAVASHILETFEHVKIKVGKTQISFSNRYGFAYVWLPFRKVKGRPDVYILLTFGLDHRVVHPRIIEAVEPYPRRWTHHVMIEHPDDLDEQVMDWIRESYHFSMIK